MKKLVLAVTLLASLSLLGCSWTSSNSVSSSNSAVSLTSYPDSGIYAITTSVPTGHGHLSTSKKQAETGLSITITVTAEPGYLLESISSEQTPLTAVVPGETYSFVMPAQNVTVAASFILANSSSSHL